MVIVQNGTKLAAAALDHPECLSWCKNFGSGKSVLLPDKLASAVFAFCIIIALYVFVRILTL
jgi:hypothetical protein